MDLPCKIKVFARFHFFLETRGKSISLSSSASRGQLYSLVCGPHLHVRISLSLSLTILPHLSLIKTLVVTLTYPWIIKDNLSILNLN